MHYSTRSMYKNEIILAWIMGALLLCFIMGQDHSQLGAWLRVTFPGAILCGQLSDIVVAWATSSGAMMDSMTTDKKKGDSQTDI